MIQDSTFEASSHSVLIIDDEEAICEMIEFKLSKEGYRVSWITNPLEAIGKARDFEPDIIILDVMMPELDGFRLCSMLRVDGVLKHVPILFLTAKNEVEDRIKGFNRGGDDYLTKPFSENLLVIGQTLFGPDEENTLFFEVFLHARISCFAVELSFDPGKKLSFLFGNT